MDPTTQETGVRFRSVDPLREEDDDRSADDSYAPIEGSHDSQPEAAYEEMHEASRGIHAEPHDTRHGSPIDESHIGEAPLSMDLPADFSEDEDDDLDDGTHGGRDRFD